MNRIEALAEWMRGKSDEWLYKWNESFEANPANATGAIYHAYMGGKIYSVFDPFTQAEVKAALEMALRPEPLPDMAARLGRIREAALRLQAELTVLLETLEE